MINSIRIFLMCVEIVRIVVFGLCCLGEENFNEGLLDLLKVIVSAGLLYFLWTYPVPR
jgi:hypothetical protein